MTNIAKKMDVATQLGNQRHAFGGMRRTVEAVQAGVIGDVKEDPKNPDLCPEVHGFAATSNGFALRFGLESFVEPSTRSGRRWRLLWLGTPARHLL